LRGERPRISEDRDLVGIDLASWECLNQPGGSAKTEDGVERNQGKNRSAVELAGLTLPNLDTAAFVKQIAAFDSQTKWKRRKDLTGAQKTELDALEKKIVSFTGYLVIAYAGPPETTNCASVDFHDWHLEIFEKPMDHPPHVGDPTGIVCEITPRTQKALYAAGIRLRNLAAFIRRPDLTCESTGHSAQKIRLTGYLLWDDDHNGRADIGPTIESTAANGYSHPWRSTAWEMHPVIKIDALETAVSGTTSLPAASAARIPTTPSPSAQPRASVAVQTVTILEPVKVKILYGETLLPRGMRLELLSRGPQTLTVRYLDTTVTVPIQSTDLR